MGEVLLARSFEVPVDDGDGLHLAPPLAGDAAQLEALVGHGLRVRVQLHASAATQRRCGVWNEKNNKTGMTNATKL